MIFNGAKFNPDNIRVYFSVVKENRHQLRRILEPERSLGTTGKIYIKTGAIQYPGMAGQNFGETGAFQSGMKLFLQPRNKSHIHELQTMKHIFNQSMVY